MSSVNTNAPFGAIASYRAICAISNVFSYLAARKSAYQTRNALRRLSDRDLNDIGLTRHDIDRVSGCR